MKRKRPHNRGMALPPLLVSPGADDQLNFGRFSGTGRRSDGTRRIFVIKKTSRLASANAGGRKIRRILVFDNHPDSLRLVFGRRRHPDVDLSQSHRGRSWEVIIVSGLTLAGLVGMFWPLF